MIAAWLTKAAKPVIIVLLLILAAFVLGLLTIKTVNGMIGDAVTRTVAERNAFWTAGIEAANTKVAEAEARQARYALDLERDTNAKLDALRIRKEELETLNASLPNGGDCGLGRDRVRLLPH
ncbi:elongation factor P--beta-lysine ligase [Agrobacterium larrymoorei]|uniref:Elongation factor P--beta-lysine ligase n=1 Tax=Agrobacterium larrymoorei TaxID=160699 RepID=A0AAJ2ES65_9HYPH|nr:hypothetical protein [Agrobacterium larrymoorei]MDR6102776.1 elongation factor P--beta-lysine ligase [Agrobacterium larrymoorei]